MRRIAIFISFISILVSLFVFSFGMIDQNCVQAQEEDTNIESQTEPKEPSELEVRLED